MATKPVNVEDYRILAQRRMLRPRHLWFARSQKYLDDFILHARISP